MSLSSFRFKGELVLSRLLFGLLLLLLVGGVRTEAAPAPVPPVPARGKVLRPELALQIGHTLPVLCVAFSPNGKVLASGSRDNTIKLWDTASGALRRTLSGQKGIIMSVAFSPDGKVLASGGSDAAIRFWDAATGAMLRTLRGHDSSITSIAFSPDGKTLVSGSYDDTIKLWNVQAGTLGRT